MNDKIPRAFTLGYHAAERFYASGEHVDRVLFDTEEETAAFNEGFYEACDRISDLVSDAYSCC